MTKKDLLFIKSVHDQILEGTYDPEKLSKAYQLIAPNNDQFFVNVQQKKRVLAGFIQYQYETAFKNIRIEEEKLTKKIEEPLLKEQPKKETIVLEKPTSTKSKRVYKRKPRTPKKKINEQ